ncbi:branched-chain alpha-keto acid dehydrogenase subunit E2 [Marivivens niveibacter]|uniref:Endolytic murein transglycosylase n=1 Tax=Marivivens niveibacter TaxID=1930667 RepID=A0A251X2S7_9RHOB|nr:endolytic transglycosylase MltG [Marivivens niveibacter]OUD10688.1 branched-chain alpha-keto acid dehydrogenase subunit E2 [Marivivens niveibacter]
MWKAIASNALTLFIVILFLLGGVILWGKDQYVAEGPLEQGVCFKVESGTVFRRVAPQLEEIDAIANLTVFNIGVKYSGLESQLKAGSFLLTPGMSMDEIAHELTRSGQSSCGSEIVYRVGVNAATAELRATNPETGAYEELAQFDLGAADVPSVFVDAAADDDTEFRVVIAEGVTSWQVLNSLSSIGVLEHDVDTVPAEGSLAPNSYYFAPGDSVSELINEMVTAQAAILAEAWEGRDDDLPFDTPEEALILASIVEKETGIAGERPQVASVFVNRLRQGMRLQTDPTVIYGITNGEGVLGRGIRRSELDRATPYNTYQIDGLPPTPIANPGRDAIFAAVNPDETDYIFFVAKTLNASDGHAFAVTLAEHNRNVANLRALEAAAQ